MSALYFAYGSNLLTERLTARCPSAVPLGRAVLPDHEVAFAKRSQEDQSGKATILPAQGRLALGVVFRLSVLDLNVLDRIEGVGHGYHRLDDLEVIGGRTRHTVSTYMASAPGDTDPPWDWYLALVLSGTRQHGLGAQAEAALGKQPYRPDPDHQRPGRIAAVAALEAAGFADWERSLG